MNIRSWIFTAIFFAVSLNSVAQQVRISSEFNLKTEDRYQVLGEYDDRVLLFMDRGGQIQIEVYEKDLTFIRSVPLRLEERSVRIAGVIKGGGNFSFIYHYRGDNGRYNIKARKYNKDVQLVDSVTVASYQRRSNPRILFDVSADESKAMILRLIDDRRLETMVVDIWGLRPLWTQTFEFANSLRSAFRQALVTNRGDVFIVGEKDRRGFSRSALGLEIVSYSVDGNLRTGEVIVPELRVTDFTIKYDNLNYKLVCGGIYADKNESRTTGNFIIHVDPFDPSNYQVAVYPFDKDVLIDVYGGDATKRNGIDYLEPRDIILREDGGLVFITEITKVLNRRGNYDIAGSMPSRASRWVDYYYEDLILMSVHPEGAEHWTEVLRKKQYSQDDEGVYSSYFLFSAPSHVRLLYNDEISNNNTVSEYVVAPDGRYDRNSVLSTDYQRLKLVFSKAVQISGKSFIVPSERQGRLNLVKVEYPTESGS